MIGAIVGDIIGSVYERAPIKTQDFPLFHPQGWFTDDNVHGGLRRRHPHRPPFPLMNINQLGRSGRWTEWTSPPVENSPIHSSPSIFL